MNEIFNESNPRRGDRRNLQIHVEEGHGFFQIIVLSKIYKIYILIIKSKQ